MTVVSCLKFCTENKSIPNAPCPPPHLVLHTHLVARPIAEIFLHYNIKELHVSLTHGLWRYDNWGYPVVDAPSGAEIWAWFSGVNLTDHEVDAQWKNFCGTLSGLLCASLSFIDSTNTLKPEYSFRPQYTDAAGRTQSPIERRHIRYATLPREIVCTENMTPLKKLLPCSNANGFATLLSSGFIHSTNYHSLGLHIRSLCSSSSSNDGSANTAEPCRPARLEIRQTVNLVFDKQLISPNRDWSLRKMFGQGLADTCYLADTSRIYIDVTDNEFDVTPEPTRYLTSQRGGASARFAEYDMREWFPSRMFNVAAVYRDKSMTNIQLISPPPLFAKRFTLGSGQERGKIVTKVTNAHWSELNVVLQENIPWFVAVYLHTLTIKQGNVRRIEPAAIKYVPGVRRVRPYHLEVAFRLPARTTVEIAIDFDFIFLKWLEYPPDANHGHYLGAAVLSAQLPVARNVTAVPVDGCLFADSFNASRPGYFVQIRTESLLISMPTPDFSMPYNVICLTCTVVALAFGPIHNLSTKKIVVAKDKAKSSFWSWFKWFGRKKRADNDAADTMSEQTDDLTKEQEETVCVNRIEVE